MAKKDFDFSISKGEINKSFTMIPNILITDLMNYLTYNELRLLLYIYQKDNNFRFNRYRIAEKFSTHKKNIDKIFSSLEKKQVLIKTQNDYEINLHVDYSGMKINKITDSIKKIKSYPEKPSKNTTSRETLGEVKHTSHEVKSTSLDLGSEVRDTPPTEVKDTPSSNSTIATIDETLRETKSSNNTNNNNTNDDLTKSDNYINIDKIEINSNSVIDKPENDRLSPKTGLKKDLIKSIGPNTKNENQIINSIEFLIEHDPSLVNDFKDLSCDPNMFPTFSDSYIALIVLSYKLQAIPQWKEVKDSLEFNWKYLGALLYTCKSALALQFFNDIPNNLAKEIIAQSKLCEEDLVKLFYNSSN